ncbi:uncharacterized protein LOC129596046 [Paramacrobiotus metropolitanus]|uniref:uncharacterized protein LOC129596046 n=1 Tax=Paramacrobiotus metropolitanus TaxID=2943436 RepID=UPI002445DE3C|nr:uncharacterized protein LOC129596046 [Paramacrobiotus metropolitanus]
MWRIVQICALVLWCAGAYALEPRIQVVPQPFGNCTVEDAQAISQCTTNIQNQTQSSEAVMDQFMGVFLTGNITEQEAKALVDAYCSWMAGTVGCLRPSASRCFDHPFMLLTYTVYNSLLGMCSAPNRYKYFADIVRCNKRLDVISTLSIDQELANITQEIFNFTTQSLGSNSNVAAILDFSSEEYTRLSCRMVRRVENLISLEKVSGTCGTEAHEAYSSLYRHILQMYKCSNNNTSGGGNGAGFVQPANGYTLYSLFTILFAIVFAHQRN